jgi:DNA mismatch repair protein MutS2
MAKKRIADHTLQVLEYRSVLDLLTTYASNELGRAAIRSLYPSIDGQWIQTQLAQTAEVLDLHDQDRPPPLAGIRDIRAYVRASDTGSTLFEPHQLLQIADTLSACMRLRAFLADLDPHAYRHLQLWVPHLHDFSVLIESLDRSIDGDGTVKDTASPKLSTLRRRIENIIADLRGQFEQLVSRPALRAAVENSNFLIRHGRPVVAVRENYRSRVPGTILDRSNSGATLYIEPDSLVPLSNALEEARFAEKKEIDRLLWELTHLITPRAAEIRDAVRTLGRIDMACAKARFSHAYHCHIPTVVPDGPLRLRDARHPLLLKLMAERPVSDETGRPPEVVPISPRLGDDFNLLLVTGPNTGGKTVLLKTIGLCVLMGQSGIPIPAHRDSQMPVYRRVFADIGDEQSLEQNLSTFSAHMKHILDIIRQTDGATLVLLDELGAGTDPDEGAALGTVILDRLLSQKGHIVATTHLGRLKTFAYGHAQAENGSVSFDSDTLQPTYALCLGTPGSSNALLITERLGMPQTLLRKADQLMQSRNQDATRLIEQLQRSRRAAEQRRQQAQGLLDQAERAQRDANAQLQDAQAEGQRLKRLAEVELAEAMRQIRAVTEQLERNVQNAPARWREIVTQSIGRVRELAAHTPLAKRHQIYLAQLKKGDEVYAIPFKRRAIVERLRRKRQTVVLLMGAKQIELPFEQICRPENQ